MNISQIFFERYDPLSKFFLPGIWEVVPFEKMRQRPHPRVNSIAWILWHMARVEDAGLNRFVVDRIQVLDDGSWMERMKIPWRHHASEMSSKEVDTLNEKIDLSALHDYSLAVQKRTLEIVPTLSLTDLDDVMKEERLRQIMVDEGLAHSNPEGFIKNYLGWSKSKCLMTFGLTHSFQHIGEIETIATLLGVVFE
jgi:uncharacterized damage-inducible protein DinB